MKGYSDDIKEEVRAANDIVDVISSYVQLKRKGRYYFGLCPFHSENSPSFSVKPDRQYFHCFGCHAGGDVFSFISRIENKTFSESLEYLAERANIKLPSLSDDNNPQVRLKDKMFSIYADSTIFYHERLYKPLAKTAQDYIKQRKLNNSMLEQFKIGYSGTWNELYKFLHNKGYTDKEIEATGLCIKSKKGEYFDFFRDRLMFPVMNVSGKVMAFGGRRLDGKKEQKYINSNDSLIFKKRDNLFALNFAKKSQSKNIVLVEGYMDAIALQKFGFLNAVASLGTALTENQARLIKKYTDNVIIGYDQDGAGQAATLRGLDILANHGLNVKVLKLDRDDVKDPDEYLNKYGPERLKNCIDKAISLVEFKVDILEKDLNLDNFDSKVRFLTGVSNILAKIDNNIERDLYIDKISKKYGMSPGPIIKEVEKGIKTKKEDTVELDMNSLNKKMQFYCVFFSYLLY